MTTAGKGPDTSTDRVFISYSNENHTDRQVADMVYEALKSNGIPCWVAHRDIFPGQNWPDEISKAITKSRVMIVVLSSYTQKSRYVKREVTQAADENLTIIPYCIENISLHGGLRLLLSDCQWINAYVGPPEKQLDQLLESLPAYLGQEPGKPVTPKKESPTGNVEPVVTSIKAAKEESNESADRPEAVKAVIPKASKVEKNGKGFWEAHYQDEIVMVYIPPGEFTMGQTEEEKKWLIDQVGEEDYNSLYTSETPLHNVYLEGYWIGKYEVVFAQYDRYCEETAREKPDDSGWGRDKRPVINVTWVDASAYCKWFSNTTGLKFNLPTEARWEKAARGTDRRKYPWGNREPEETLANFNSIISKTTAVGSCPEGASPYGLLDMVNNVWEWCSDWYDPGYYKNSPLKDPQGPSSGTDRVIRGGGWSGDARDLRCADRSNDVPSSRGYALGFRLCQDIK